MGGAATLTAPPLERRLTCLYSNRSWHERNQSCFLRPQLVKEARIWAEGAPAAPVERKAGVEPAVSMAHMVDGERNVQTNNNRKVWMLCAGRAPRRRFRIGGGEDGLGDARLPDEVGRSFVRCHAQIMLPAGSTRRHRCQMRRFHS